MGLDFPAIGRAALDRAEFLVPTWCPVGRREGDEWVTKNPRRDDRKAGSFSINLKTGVWKDFAADDGGGDLVSLYAFLFTHDDQGEAARAVGRETGTITPDAPKAPRRTTAGATVPKTAPRPPATHHELGAHSGEWIYRSDGGEELYRVRRYDTPNGKEYRPLSFKDGKWAWGYPSEPRPLYGLNRLADPNKGTVLVVEGEKAADAGVRLFPSLAVVTSPAGAKAAKKADWTPLQFHEVVIWPDHDGPGLGFAGEVVAELKKQGIVARVVDIPKTWPDKWDLADAPPAGVLPDTLQGMIDAAAPWAGEPPSSAGTPAPAPLRLLDTSEWGIRKPTPLTWYLEGLVPQGQPGLLAGRSNSGKSLFGIQLLQAGALGCGLFGLPGPGGPRFSLYVSMEDGEEELERRWARCLAITSEDHRDWSADHVRQIQRNVQPLIPDWASPCSKTLSHLVEMIERVFRQNRPVDVEPGLILLDTLAALAEGEENKAEVQQAFWAACHHITVATGATVMALHHTKKPLGVKPPTMTERMSFDFIRGSSAIVAGARFVLQMEPILQQEGEALGLDADRVAAGNYPVLGLSKQVSGPKGDWLLLEQRTSQEQGGGFFTPHPDADHLITHMKGKGARKKLGQLEALLLDIHQGITDTSALVNRHWPDLGPEDGKKKLKGALADMRRRNRQWLKAGSMELTAPGFMKAQALGMPESIKSGLDAVQLSNPETDGASNDAA